MLNTFRSKQFIINANMNYTINFTNLLLIECFNVYNVSTINYVE